MFFLVYEITASSQNCRKKEKKKNTFKQSIEKLQPENAWDFYFKKC